MIKLSDYVMDFLVAKGVRHVFMLPGGGAMHLNDSLGRRKEIQYTCFLHEQALAIAAESYGQFTNFPGVGLVTSGPGSTNAITGVAAAYIDSTPCVFISGQAKRADLKGNSGVRQMGSQEVDIVSMVSCITKYAVTVLEPDQIRYHLEKAWHLATTARMGPVWLDIPLDVQGALIEEKELKGFYCESKKPADRDYFHIAEVTKILNNAQRPLILAGNGVKLAGAEGLLCKFAENNQIPIVLTWKAIDFLDHNHPLNFGSPGIMGSRYANFIVQNCDLLLILGSRLDPSITAFNSANFGKNAKKIMVDIDDAEIRKIANIDLPIVADAGEFLRSLSERQSDIKSSDRNDWLSYCRRLKERYPVVLDEYRKSDENINLYVFTEALFKQLSAEDIITPESSGAAGEVTYQAICIKKGQKVKNAAGLGSMGFGLPYAIGACIANNRKRTILINGDGAFQLNIQELETLARLKLPVKMFIFENNGYGSIMATQKNMFNGFYVGSEPNSGLTLPDLGAIARAYGIRHERATNHIELNKVIARTLDKDDPVLCGIKVSQLHITAPRVQSMKLPDGSMVSKPLEDMWPYLPPEELEQNMIAKGKTL
ncbi:MAG: thiamine pyrophosphate-binding protein [Candidatus Omnitrophica bacterium]|nr:thiamine pyrophosphate-binding protein [Candidatus Omnitrophota bacterium]